MQLLLTTQIAKRLHREMRRAGQQEIGGLLMGEHVAEEVFRISDISVQRSGGTHVSFIRDPSKHRAQLQQFFARTGQDYSRFNYLGEWHSHPSFEPTPSPKDIQTMQSIIEDDEVGANFLTLVIITLANEAEILMTAMAFRAGMPPIPVRVSIETENEADSGGTAWGWLRRIFKR
jgi:integrative and conjugative element protein (TIGR02256 family)